MGQGEFQPGMPVKVVPPRPFDASEQIDKLAVALAKAQATIKTAKKSSTNPHFKSRYADLAEVFEACVAELAANQIAFTQLPKRNAAAIGVTTVLFHASGQWMASTLEVMPQDLKPQSVGSALTYVRRYSLAAMVGVASEDDDDGEGAMGRVCDVFQGAEPLVTPDQRDILEAALEKAGKKEAAVMKWLGYGQTLVDVKARDYQRVLDGAAKKTAAA